jgi:hypothetical protein
VVGAKSTWCSAFDAESARSRDVSADFGGKCSARELDAPMSPPACGRRPALPIEPTLLGIKQTHRIRRMDAGGPTRRNRRSYPRPLGVGMLVCAYCTGACCSWGGFVRSRRVSAYAGTRLAAAADPARAVRAAAACAGGRVTRPSRPSPPVRPKRHLSSTARSHPTAGAPDQPGTGRHARGQCGRCGWRESRQRTEATAARSKRFCLGEGR